MCLLPMSLSLSLQAHHYHARSMSRLGFRNPFLGTKGFANIQLCIFVSKTVAISLRHWLVVVVVVVVVVVRLSADNFCHPLYC